MAQDDNNQQAPERYTLNYQSLNIEYKNPKFIPDVRGKWCKWEDVEKLLQIIENQKEALIRKQAPTK